MDFTFLKFILSWNNKKKKYIVELLEKYQEKPILIFKSRRELDKWFEEEFENEIHY